MRRLLFAILSLWMSLDALGQVDSNEVDSGRLKSLFFLGCSFSQPMFRYGDDNIANEEAGFAQPGFGISFGYREFLKETPVFLRIGFDAVIHRSSLGEEIVQVLETEGLSSEVYENPVFLTFPIKLGMGIGERKGKGSLYAEGVVGFAFSKYTEGIVRVSGEGQIPLRSAFATTFCWGGETGIYINNRIQLSLSYTQVQDANFVLDTTGSVSGLSFTLTQQYLNFNLAYLIH